ncbi:sodium:solute symporter family protein [uncultured Draconibacterium sp.]|uniref:sodium:solute symporter family protein n=1 Tax=uncultured Draconibacterium sp. TaxID=1573823 RepID=UPI0025E603DE|nr:sodium:solute symporter family protein [uncultured Draconibacterium sp.]
MNTFTLGFVVVIYLLVIGYLGYKGYKTTKSAKDYLLAGREIHPFVMAMSYGATFISTSAIIGFGGVAGVYGMGLIWLTVLNIFVGVFIAFIFFGRITRKMGHNLDAHTFPEFLGNRFQSKKIQIISGAVIFIAMPLYAAVVLIGGARFIESIFEIDFSIALTFFSLIIAAYVIAGGLKGVMYTDALQGTIMFLSLFFLLIVSYIKLGGVSAAHEALTNMANLVPESLQAKGHEGWTAFPKMNSAWWWVLVTNIILGVGIGVLAQPQLVVRFMTVKSNRELNRAVLIGGVFIFVATGFIFTVGGLTNLFFYNESGQLAIQVAKGNVDLIIPEYINAAMPEWFVYLFMLALLSAGMSTLSSQFHAMGTSLGRDFFENVFPNKKFDTMFVTRIGIIVGIAISILIGYQLPGSIVARGTAIFFGVCAAAFLPVYFASLYWKRVSKTAAMWSILSGLLASVFALAFMHVKESEPLGICQAIFGQPTLATKFPWMIMDPIIIAMPISIIVLVAVSLATPKTSDEHLAKCFKGIN